MADLGIKELENVVLKTTFNIEINGKKYAEGEPLFSFDKIQIGLLSEQTSRVSARGGVGNQSLILWENTSGMSIQLSEGVISKEGLSILSNSQLMKTAEDIIVPYSEVLHSTREKISERLSQTILLLKYSPSSDIYVYRNGEKITNFTNTGNKIILSNEINDIVENEEPTYVVYYNFIYRNKNTMQLSVGRRAVKSFLSMTGRMRVKDDQTGKETTCLVEFPKVELTSDLTMRLGSNVNPYIYGFSMMAHPVGERGNQYVCKQTFLEEDIDADI